MTQFALAAQTRNALLVTVATLALAACGGESGSANTTATAAGSDATGTQQVAENAGMIDRSQGIGENESATSNATNTAAPASAGTTSGTATSGSGASGTGTTTVGTGSKATTPVQVVTTNGVATLDWMPPTQNSDGSVLTNLAGYTVYYGTSPNDLSQSVKVANPGLTAYSVTSLSSGTWYFAVTSYSTDGVESSRTSTVSTTI